MSRGYYVLLDAILKQNIPLMQAQAQYNHQQLLASQHFSGSFAFFNSAQPPCHPCSHFTVYLSYISFNIWIKMRKQCLLTNDSHSSYQSVTYFTGFSFSFLDSITTFASNCFIMLRLSQPTSSPSLVLVPLFLSHAERNITSRWLHRAGRHCIHSTRFPVSLQNLHTPSFCKSNVSLSLYPHVNS